MALDTISNEGAQLVRRDSVKLNRGGGAEFLRAGVALLRRASWKVPLLDLLTSNRRTLEMNLGTGSVATELGLDVTGGVDTGRVVIAEMVDVSRLILRRDRHRCAVKEAQRGVTACHHQRHVVGFSLLHQHAREGILLAPHLDVDWHRRP